MKVAGSRSLVGIVAVTFAFGGLLATPVSAGTAQGPSREPVFSWELVDAGTDQTFTGLDAVSARTVWAGVFTGQLFRSTDGGATFTDVAPDGTTDHWAFLDVEAASKYEALAQVFDDAAGMSYIFRTIDGGASWQKTLSVAAFIDCTAMFNDHHGFAVGDPVDGKFQIFVTNDAGRSWDLLPGDGMPPALEGEFGLAFGGDCAEATGTSAFFGTGGAAEGARVFRSTDFGVTWSVVDVPILEGISSLSFRTNKLGLVGGFARTTDGGLTFERPEGAPTEGGQAAWWTDYRGGTKSPSDAQRTAFEFGPDASYVSRDRGKTWTRFEEGTFYGIDCVARSRACWASGPDGRIAKLVVS